MADNYLEKRQEEIARGSHKNLHNRPSLDTLLMKNRSCRSFRVDCKVHPLQLRSIVSVNTKVACGMNAQRLRFRLVTDEAEASKLLPLLKLGAALPELQLPPKDREPSAYIVVCAICEENPIVDIDLGISLQSMLLKATEMGLAGVIVRNFDPAQVKALLGLPHTPLAIVPVGKSAETAALVKAESPDNLRYYRERGVHCVPKLGLEDLLI